MHPSRGTTAVAYRAVLLAAGLLVLGPALRAALTLLLAVLITVIVAIALASVADRLEAALRHPAPDRGAGWRCSAGSALIAGVIALIIAPFIDQTNEFVDDVPGIVDDLRDQIHDATGAQAGRDRRPGAGVRRELHRRAGEADRADHLDRPQRGGRARRADPGPDHRLLHRRSTPTRCCDGLRRLVPPAPPGPGRRDHAPPARLLDRLDAGGGGGHGRVRRPALHRAHDHRPGLRDLLRGAHGAVLGGALLRRHRQRHPARAVRAHRLAGQGAARCSSSTRSCSSSRAT